MASAGTDLLSSVSRRLSLKLDYDGVLNAWPDQSPLYVDEEEAHQVVPDLHHTAAPVHYSAVSPSPLVSSPSLTLMLTSSTSLEPPSNYFKI